PCPRVKVSPRRDGGGAACADLVRPPGPARAVPQPFTLSAGRRTLGTSRRVAVPLFELLDRLGHTRPTPDGLRHLVASSDATP
ncbi:SelB C-terminal domain-containing protein, partial [Streptomyces sp. NPDC048411]|uniref:SelB domain-containing protein n=1 Tax=Streptomyces sp. NPDC048411 TaxID=3157206 RepID=UPI0034568283